MIEAFTGHDIARVKRYIINSGHVLGAFETLRLLDLLAIVQRDRELRLNKARQARYQSNKFMEAGNGHRH